MSAPRPATSVTTRDTTHALRGVTHYPAPRDPRCPFDPSPTLRAVQESSPITRVTIWDGSTPWLITGHAQARALLRDPRVSAAPEHPSYPHSTPSKFMHRLGFLTMDAPEHTRQRHSVAKPFSAKRIEMMRTTIESLVGALIDQLLAGPKPVDLFDVFALPLPCSVICHLLGVPYDDHEFFAASARKLIDPHATQADAEAVRQGLLDYIEQLLVRKRAAPADDMLSELANEHVAAGAITQNDAAMNGMLMLLGGFDTTANTIALSVLALTENQAQRDILTAMQTQDEVAAAIEELLRYTAVPQGGRRRVATQDIEIDGVLISAGDGLVIAGDLANRDASVISDPDRLDLRRPPHKHLTFGHGPHQCLGMPLARLELQVAIPTLLRRIPTLRRAVPLSDVKFREHGIGIYGVDELPMTWS